MIENWCLSDWCMWFQTRQTTSFPSPPLALGRGSSTTTPGVPPPPSWSRTAHARTVFPPEVGGTGVSRYTTSATWPTSGAGRARRSPSCSDSPSAAPANDTIQSNSDQRLSRWAGLARWLRRALGWLKRKDAGSIPCFGSPFLLKKKKKVIYGHCLVNFPLHN